MATLLGVLPSKVRAEHLCTRRELFELISSFAQLPCESLSSCFCLREDIANHPTMARITSCKLDHFVQITSQAIHAGLGRTHKQIRVIHLCNEAVYWQAAGVAWWYSGLAPSREDAHSIPNPDSPFSTLGIGASPLFRDLVGRFCWILNMARLVPKKIGHRAKIGDGTARTRSTKKKRKAVWHIYLDIYWATGI